MGVRHYPDVPRGYIDQDGPLADLVAAAEATGLPIKVFKCQAGAYRRLPVTPGAREAIAELEGLGLLIFVLTKAPSSNPYSATEKLLWMGEVFPQLQDRTIISSDKGCVGSEHDFLVDDHPEWANAESFRGTVITWDHNWPEVVEQIRAAIRLKPQIIRHKLRLHRAGLSAKTSSLA